MDSKPSHIGLLGSSWNSIEGAGLEENPLTVAPASKALSTRDLEELFM